MTIRLSPEQAEALETVASVEQRPISDVIRAAISEHIELRRKDPGFRAGLEECAAALQRAAIAFFELDQQRLAVSRPGAFLGGLVISPCLLLGKSCGQFTSTDSRSAKIFMDIYAVLFPVLPNVI